MKKSTFIKSVHKALRDAGIWRDNKDMEIGHVRYQSFINESGDMVVEVLSARNSSTQRRGAHCGIVSAVLGDAGISHSPAQNVYIHINFKDNGVED